MRALVVAALLVATGCPHAGSDVTGAGYDDAGCKLTCDHCPPLALCVGLPYVPACLVQCQSSADCDLGLKCAVIGADSGPGVCVGPASLTACHPTDCQIVAECRNAKTALIPLPKGFSACGWEIMNCDSGCDPATGSCK